MSTRQRTASTARRRGALACVLVGLALLAGCGAEPTPATVQAQEAAAIAQAAAETAAIAERSAAQVERARTDAAIARLQAESAARDAAAADRWRAPTAAARSLGLIALYGLPAVALAVALGWAWSRRGLIWARKGDGTLPVFRGGLSVELSAATIAARHASELALASVATPSLTSLTYSPRSEYRNDVDVAGGELPALPPATAPAFRDLAMDPTAVYLGAGAAGPVMRPWEQFLTLGLGGQTGSGKTWTAVSLTLQALAGGHRVVLADPHSANPDSLAARLAPVHARLWRPVATTDAEIAAAADAVERTMRARAEGRADDLTPVTFVVDELSKVMRGELAEVIARILEGIAQEGRKLKVRAILLGQRWSASRTGGSGDLRDTIPDVLLHRMRRVDARMLSGWPIDDLPDTSTLAPGECYLLAGEDVVRVTQPRMSAADVAAFAATLPADGQGLTRATPGPGQGRTEALEAVTDPAGTDPGPGADPEAETFRRRVVELFLAGDDMGAITDNLAGTRGRSGGAWKRTRQRVEAVLRAELGGAA